MHIELHIFFVAIWVHFDSPDLSIAFPPFSHNSIFFISVNHGFPTFEIFVSVEVPTAFAVCLKRFVIPSRLSFRHIMLDYIIGFNKLSHSIKSQLTDFSINAIWRENFIVFIAIWPQSSIRGVDHWNGQDSNKY